MNKSKRCKIYAAELIQLEKGSYPLSEAQLVVLNEPSTYNFRLEDHKELKRLGLLESYGRGELSQKGKAFIQRREEYLAKQAEGSVSSVLIADDLDWSRVVEVYAQAYVDNDDCEPAVDGEEPQFYSVFAVLATDYQEEQQQGTVLVVSDHASKDAALDQVKQLCETHSISKHYFIEQEG